MSSEQDAIVEAQDVIAKVEHALDAVRRGEMVILTDDEDRENEGDLCMAADLCTPETINFMAKHARGLICLSLTEAHAEKLGLAMMVDENQSSRTTAFTVSIEAREGVTTGISAADRAHTVRTAVAAEVKAEDIVSPGHIFPLKACPGGVLQRTGHTEGSVDLARLAGRSPAGVICEIMNDDGTMARAADLEAFAEEHGIPLLSIADLIEYRLRQERLIECVEDQEVTLSSGKKWRLRVFEVDVDSRQFLALTHGDIDESPMLTRVHTTRVLGDVLGLNGPKQLPLSDAISRIETEGRGVLLLIPGGSQWADELRLYAGQPVPSRILDQGSVLREYGLGAQVLAGLGVREIRLLTKRARRIPSLEGYGLKVVEQIEM